MLEVYNNLKADGATPLIFFFFWVILAVVGFVFPYEFYKQFVSFYKKPLGILTDNGLNLQDNLENWHINNIESSNISIMYISSCFKSTLIFLSNIV